MTTIEEKLRRIDQLQQEIAAMKPLDQAELQQLRAYYRIGLTYSSNALEGNSLTESDTKIVLEDGIAIGGKPLRDHLEAVGHSAAFDCMYRLITRKTIREQDALELHRLFYEKIDPQNAGIYRRVRALITGSAFKLPLPDRISPLMKDLIKKLPALRKRHHPVIYAALLHKAFVEIHPFIDGNGRTARLLMNLALLQHGYPLVIIPPILRSEYIQALERSHSGDDAPFFQLIAAAVIEAQKDFLRLFGDQ